MLGSFFAEIKGLTEQYATYKNIIFEMEYLLKTEGAKVSPELLENGRVGIGNIRFYSHKVYVHFSTLVVVLDLKEEDTKEIKAAYEKINDLNTTLPAIKDIEDFVIKINQLLVKDVIKNLLQTSQDILNSLYR